MNRWESQPLLEVEHLTMRFGGLVAINDLTFTVGEGDITALIGPNGAGKTTVFNCITGFYKPTEGRISLRHGAQSIWQELPAATASPGQHWKKGDSSLWLLERMPDFKVSAHAKVARTFQNIRLFQGMTVLENLLVAQHNPLMLASGMSIFGILGLPLYRHAEKKSIAKAEYWLDKIDLTDPCLAVPGVGSRRPAPWAPSRTCCASTSRPPASIRVRAPSSTSCCAPSATRKDAPCSSSNTTCRW